MHEETFEVVGLQNQRDAYEAESYISGMGHVSEATVDVVEKQITVVYDTDSVNRSEILQYISHAGCVPAEESGFLDRVKSRL